MEELPFMATENILMYCVKKGGDRQALHEAIREHSVAVAKKVKLEGCDNDLLERILADERFALTEEELKSLINVKNFIGCADKQTDTFLQTCVAPVLAANQELIGIDVKISV